MKKIALLILCAVMVLSFTGCGKKDAATGDTAQVSAVNVKVEEVMETSIVDTVSYSGEVKSTEAIVVSSDALLEAEDGTKYVYIVDGDNAKRADVVTGIVTDEVVEIISGISVGDKVIVSGKEYISEKNTAIKIVD